MTLLVILFEPENPGNVGAICRAMKNFGLSELILINPKYAKGISAKKHIEAIKRAKHAGDVLRKAKIIGKKDAAKFFGKLDLLVGTTAKLGTDYNIARTPVLLENAAKMINSSAVKGSVGVLFGPEGEGLSNEEIKKCDYITTIPTSVKYRALNISQAATIIFYELFKSGAEANNMHEKFAPATQREKEVLLEYLARIIDNMHFATPEKKQTQEILWKRIIGKANLSKREAFALCGFFRKLLKQK